MYSIFNHIASTLVLGAVRRNQSSFTCLCGLVVRVFALDPRDLGSIAKSICVMLPSLVRKQA